MKIEISNDSKWQQSFTLKIALPAVMGLFLLMPETLKAEGEVRTETRYRSIYRAIVY